MKLYYIIDAYCGWTYGFNHILTKFMEKHPELELEVINGGLFAGENKKRMADFQQAQTINKKIEAYYQMSFGQAYNQLFLDKEFTMDSLGPAQAFSVLKNHVAQNQLAHLSLDIQNLFFENGLNLSQAETYTSLLEKYQVPDFVKEELVDRLGKSDELHEDFIKSYEMGIQSFPTLLLEKDGKFFNLINQVQTVNDLERNFQSLAN